MTSHPPIFSCEITTGSGSRLLHRQHMTAPGLHNDAICLSLECVTGGGVPSFRQTNQGRGWGLTSHPPTSYPLTPHPPTSYPLTSHLVPVHVSYLTSKRRPVGCPMTPFFLA